MPERGLDWFSLATEACGGGTSDLGLFMMVSLFIGLNNFMYLRALDVCLAMSTRGDNGVSY